ncbi:aspartate-semialdehyde dehydrogenase [Vallitalea sp.]|jgi:aspartate-semialdehyde dehydrogenase|uniref:aspartate-semialdehyde dehydrogenase n=1 Tax=Vallitalea sp. TaxID=1882829 RepID=UPI0025D6E1E8|nr:aspartate-semialdehyde dehydrogenase [Vallitalea sp.]MCT4686896.1 aspartate-semialdehyde dehydrogenase [Vallitalea sp.]
MESKLRVGIIGATGMVGQRFISLLHDHPWYDVVCLAASPRSAGKSYNEAVKGRWAQSIEIPVKFGNMTMMDASNVEEISGMVDFVFCAVDMDKKTIRELEEAYAKAEVPVVSNNSANRWAEDVPMVIPEINDEHLKIIDAQRKRLGTKRGFIAVKPNCSIQSYVPVVNALKKYKPTQVNVCTYQAISGAGKTFDSWPEMVDNVIPYIGGEEEKSEQEPMKIWGKIENDKIVSATEPVISAQCIRVAAADGHLAAVSISFEEKPEVNEVISILNSYSGKPQELKLPSAPKQFMKYMEEDNRPQTKIDRNYENGMGVTVGRFREDNLYDYKFICLSHNTLRGAAGGAVLIAELLTAEGYITAK